MGLRGARDVPTEPAEGERQKHESLQLYTYTRSGFVQRELFVVHRASGKCFLSRIPSTGCAELRHTAAEELTGVRYTPSKASRNGAQNSSDAAYVLEW